MKVAISNNRAKLGKIQQADKDAWRVFNGSFQNVEIEPGKLLALIQQGYAYTPQHHNYRHSKNFAAGQHIALDMDTGDSQSSIAVLLQNEFIAKHATFIYTTPSHTESNPKARVVFVLDRPITNKEKYALLAESLVDRFGTADKACKDAARFFYGAMGCQSHWLGNILTLESAACELVRPYQQRLNELARLDAERLANRIVVAANDAPAAMLAKHSQSLLERVKFAPHGEKYTTLRDTSITFGGYVSGGYYAYTDVVGWLQTAIRANADKVADLRHADNTIIESLQYGMANPLYFDIPEKREHLELDIIQPPLSTEQKEQLAQIISRKEVESYHRGMTESQRLQWLQHGYDDAIVDYFGFGYCERKVNSDTGEIVLHDALTVPFNNPLTGDLVNVEYRTNSSVLYENEANAPFYFVPQQEMTDRLVILSDSLKAVDAYLYSVITNATFAGLPHMSIGENSLSMLPDTKETFVVLEPSTDTAGMGLKHLRNRARFVRLPFPMRDMLRVGAETFEWYMAQARSY